MFHDWDENYDDLATREIVWDLPLVKVQFKSRILPNLIGGQNEEDIDGQSSR